MLQAFVSPAHSECRPGVDLGWVLQVEEQVPLAAAEVYLFTWHGRLCFLPGLPWLALGRWHLPKTEVGSTLCFPMPASHNNGPLGRC